MRNGYVLLWRLDLCAVSGRNERTAHVGIFFVITLLETLIFSALARIRRQLPR
jgi:hypothetical protein